MDYKYVCKLSFLCALLSLQDDIVGGWEIYTFPTARAQCAVIFSHVSTLNARLGFTLWDKFNR